MLTYKLGKDKEGNDCCVIRSDGWAIPFVESNSMYQEYLKWVAEGNEPLPADE